MIGGHRFLRLSVLLAIFTSACANTAAQGTVTVQGLRGTQLVETVSAHEFEPTEAVVLHFPEPVDYATVKSSYTIDPASPSRIYLHDYGRSVEFTFRKIPGTTYRISLKSADVAVRVTHVPVPPPLRATPREPYRYGVLEHPFPFSLGNMHCAGPGGIGGPCTLNDISQRQVDLLCQAHTRYVRIDYNAAGILTNGSGKALLPTPNFSREDAIMDALAKCNITELPIILQYAAGPVLTGSKGGSSPMQWPVETSGLPGYADFARIVVAHIVSKYPQITRVELFNEPNNHGWGSFPIDGSYDRRGDESGMEAAAYMRPAYAAIKSVAPHMVVVGPALADGGRTTDPRKFLSTMYDNGCRRGRCWDVLSVHNYRWINPSFPVAAGAPNRFDIYKDLEHIAAAHGDANTHVMLTEWGFSTDPNSPDAVAPDVQAAYVAIGFNLMLVDPTVDGITYVNMYNAGHDFWANTALVEPNFEPKPAF